MVVRWTLSLGLHSSFVFLICSSCRVFAASPSPSSDNGGGGINVSGIPGIGITKHKWWVWLLVSLGGAFAIVVFAFVVRGILRYRKAKQAQQVKMEAVMRSREEDEELGIGMFKPSIREYYGQDPLYSSAKPWTSAAAKDPLILSAFHIPDGGSLAGGRGLPGQTPREVERRTGRHGPRPFAAPLPAGQLPRPAALQRQYSS